MGEPRSRGHDRARGGALAVGAQRVWLARTRTEYCASLDATIEYTNSRGVRFTSRVEDVLMHVVIHGAHHRGKSALRAEGAEPPYIDFIHAVRAGYLR